MKKVLVLYYSQSGQITEMARSVTAPLDASEHVKVDYCPIAPVSAYPYPWRFYPFFDILPDAISMKGCPVRVIEPSEDEYDLIIIAYSVWFLSPAVPIVGYLKSEQAQRLLKGKPVITLIACRDMWVMAQEKMKIVLEELQATLIDNVVLTDQGGSLYAFVTTPRWMLTGKKNPFLCFPAAGVSESSMLNSRRFGDRLLIALNNDEEKSKKPLLTGMGAVTVDGKLIGSEKVGIRSFMVWGNLIDKSGKPGSLMRKIVISIYAVFLFLMVLTVVPLNMLIRLLLRPFFRESIESSVYEYEKPSGR